MNSVLQGNCGLPPISRLTHLYFAQQSLATSKIPLDEAYLAPEPDESEAPCANIAKTLCLESCCFGNPHNQGLHSRQTLGSHFGEQHSIQRNTPYKKTDSEQRHASLMDKSQREAEMNMRSTAKLVGL